MSEGDFVRIHSNHLSASVKMTKAEKCRTYRSRKNLLKQSATVSMHVSNTSDNATKSE